ncbi:MAG: glycosyltransferase [Magnetococcales bacterium]|nr:glycosyltransferase [Magnetococcales bacterium]
MTTPSVPRLTVVIPSRSEPDPVFPLVSLADCDKPDTSVEVIVVINGSEEDEDRDRLANVRARDMVTAWVDDHHNLSFDVTVQYHPRLPQRQAGVGLARRLGMDAACENLLRATPKRPGIIVALDADCRVASNYLTALVEHFQKHPKTGGASLYFEHPLDGLPPWHRAGIVGYELFLRLYRQGLIVAGSPHAFHTVGSAMAVRADVYRRLGGMNRRQAGEDFYFLQKVMAHGPFSDLTTTTVFPSPRISHRVPFGTGRAMGKWCEKDTGTFMSYDPQVFSDLRSFFGYVQELSQNQGTKFACSSPVLAQFLEQQHFDQALEELRTHTATPDAFMKRFFVWFNPFRILKWTHFATECHYPKIPVFQAASTLLDWLGSTAKGLPGTEEELLQLFRERDRRGALER